MVWRLAYTNKAASQSVQIGHGSDQAEPEKESSDALNREDQEIRLIGLVDPDIDRIDSPVEHRSSKASQDIIKCHLWHFGLKQLKRENAMLPSAWKGLDAEEATTTTWNLTPGYVALSYTWGDPSQTQSIEVNGVKIQVTMNLEAALRALRKISLMRQGCALWVDSVCIDQSNTAERNEQVGRMRDIYKNAKSVVIWVGDGNKISSKAIQLMKALAAAYNRGSDELIVEALRNGNSPFPPGSWAALEAFMERPYWNRVWILQEIAMGNRSTPILCGDDMLTWGELFDAVYHSANRHIDLVFSCISEECATRAIEPKGLKRNHLIQLNRQQNIQQEISPAHYLPILDVGRKCSVSDEKDRVYGMLGMMEPGVTLRMSVDYAMSTEEVYFSFAKNMITYRNDLLILEECTWPARCGNPSWVPDWTHHDHFRLFSGEPTYHAYLNRVPAIRFEKNERVLVCSGIRIDTISGLGATYFESGTENRGDLRDEVHQSPNNSSPYASEDEVRTAIWQTLVGNRTPTGKLALPEYEALLECGLASSSELRTEDGQWRGRRAFDSLMERNRHLRLGGKPLDSYFPRSDEAGPDPTSPFDAMERMFRFWRTRRPVVSSAGHFGAVPAATEQDDEIFVLYGCTAPVVLRSTNVSEPYKLVGCCYLQGFMEGEAVHEVWNGLRQMQEVAVC